MPKGDKEVVGLNWLWWTALKKPPDDLLPESEANIGRKMWRTRCLWGQSKARLPRLFRRQIFHQLVSALDYIWYTILKQERFQILWECVRGKIGVLCVLLLQKQLPLIASRVNKTKTCNFGSFWFALRSNCCENRLRTANHQCGKTNNQLTFQTTTNHSYRTRNQPVSQQNSFPRRAKVHRGPSLTSCGTDHEWQEGKDASFSVQECVSSVVDVPFFDGGRGRFFRATTATSATWKNNSKEVVESQWCRAFTFLFNNVT